MTLATRAASLTDAPAIARIYNEGIADRIGTFETEPRSAQQIEAWFDGRHPIVVVEAGREVVAFASTSAYRSRPCYAGVAEFSVYVARHCRRAFSLRIRPAAHSWRKSASVKSAPIAGTASWTASGGIA
jgi:L-amino acid N-acyltransferase YncA